MNTNPLMVSVVVCSPDDDHSIEIRKRETLTPLVPSIHPSIHPFISIHLLLTNLTSPLQVHGADIDTGPQRLSQDSSPRCRILCHSMGRVTVRICRVLASIALG
jgi:hypothetical protein